MTASRTFAVVLAAACYALALPPFDLSWLAWIALVPLLLQVRTAHPAHAFLIGAAFGFVMSWAVTWWLTPAIADYFAASLLFGAASISAAYVTAVSLNTGLFAMGVAVLSRRALGPTTRILGIAALWVATELVRGRLLQDPWALLGYTQHGQIAVLQIATITGVYGVSFLVALGNATVAEILATSTGAQSWRERLLAPRWAMTFLAMAWVIGAVSVPSVATEPTDAARIAIVQPNVQPAFRWTRAYSERQLTATLRLTRDAVRDRPALVVWPENAVTMYLEQEPFLATQLGTLHASAGADLLYGAPRYSDGRTYNSARLLRTDGTQDHYDKRKLVPFAEVSVGGQQRSSGTVESPRNFHAGRSPGVLTSFARLGVSICHEILYPELIADGVAAGAELLVNIANDGWLDGGRGIASRQHFAMSVLRAVETRRYLIRAATTGVSGIIDPYGRVRAVSSPNVATIVAGDVHPRTGLTPYVRHGDWFPLLCLVAASALLAPRLRLRERLALPALAHVR